MRRLGRLFQRLAVSRLPLRGLWLVPDSVLSWQSALSQKLQMVNLCWHSAGVKCFSPQRLQKRRTPAFEYVGLVALMGMH